MSSRFRPGPEERKQLDSDRAALARAVMDDRLTEAKRLAALELQRQAEREVMRARRQGTR